ncbi:hypothetical protein BBJ28_00003904 [Nothophytophthora sp. Chile5]|nr:hypothetical protein BBJ28_00003904 [Nothophytophthora sp. Chile5]
MEPQASSTARDDAAMPLAQLVAGITDPQQEAEGIDRLVALTTRCSGVLFKCDNGDVELLKQMAEYLLTGRLQATDSDDASELQTAKWRLLACLLRVDSHEVRDVLLAREERLQSMFRLMLTDRFISSDVLVAMAECLVQLSCSMSTLAVPLRLLDVQTAEDEGHGQDGSVFLGLIKQMYVTLNGRSHLRQGLADTLKTAIRCKGHAKHVVSSGMLRSLLQVAWEQSDDVSNVLLLQNFVLVGTHVAFFVCYSTTEPAAIESTDAASTAKKQRIVCDLVVALMLSGSSLVFIEAVRLLQFLVDNAAYRALLPAIPDLRGALEKAQTLATRPNSKLARDTYLTELCETQYRTLTPEIDAFERQHGSVVGLPSDETTVKGDSADEQALELALREATDAKTSGNAFFRRGNFPTARMFYRYAIAQLRVAQQHEETRLRSLPTHELLAQCSIGASVQVAGSLSDEWQDAMISDVEGSQVEVIYDADDREDEWVPLARIRLRMNTSMLSAFEDLTVSCFMNMGKAFSALGDHDQAVQCFSHALALRGGTLVAALYYRGVANMALHDLTAAQQDLWNANQQCRDQRKSSSSGGSSQTNSRDAKHTRALQSQIVAAYKKLQQMHANKKRLDKKLMKQMVSYLTTIPGLQEE